MSNDQSVGFYALALDKIPVLTMDATLKKALDKMTELRIGIALIIDENQHLLGVLTDGDLRRLLLTRQNPLPALLVTAAIEFGNRKPKSIKSDVSAEEAKAIMGNEEIWDLPIVDNSGRLIGLVHRHSLN